MTPSPSAHSISSTLPKEALDPRSTSTNGILLTLPIVCRLYRLHDCSVAALAGGAIRLQSRHNGIVGIFSADIVRADMLGIQDIVELAAFCDLYGRWDKDSDTVTLETVRAFQKIVREDREVSGSKFFGGQSNMQDFLRRYPPPCTILPGRSAHIRIEGYDVNSAVRYANYVDHIANIRAKTCPSCNTQFTLSNSKKKTYCNDACQRKAGKARWNVKRGGSSAEA